MSRSKHKSSSDVVGTAKRCQELVMQRKDEERQVGEEATEDGKIHNTESGKGIFFI